MVKEINMNEVNQFLEEELKLNNQDIIVISVSGGPDSMTLLEVMNKIQKQLGFQLVCAHINHNVRKESAQELLMVQKYCREKNIPFETMTIENYTKDNFH